MLRGPAIEGTFATPAGNNFIIVAVGNADDGVDGVV